MVRPSEEGQHPSNLRTGQKNWGSRLPHSSALPGSEDVVTRGARLTKGTDNESNIAVHNDCAGVWSFRPRSGTRSGYRRGGTAVGPVYLVPRRRPWRWTRRPIQFPRPTELGLGRLPHLVFRELGAGQRLSDYLGRRKSATGQSRPRGAVLAPRHQGLPLDGRQRNLLSCLLPRLDSNQQPFG